MSLLQERMRAPRHAGPLADATGVGEVGNRACGYVLRVAVRTAPAGAHGAHPGDAGGGLRIQAARFECVGSPHQVAVASVLCDEATGRTVRQLRRLDPEMILERLPDLPPPNRHMAHLAVEALQRALDDQDRRDAPADDPPAARGLTPAQARIFLGELLADGLRRTTQQVADAAASRGVALPGGPARALAQARRDGIVTGELDAAAGAWMWGPPDADPS